MDANIISVTYVLSQKAQKLLMNVTVAPD